MANPHRLTETRRSAFGVAGVWGKAEGMMKHAWKGIRRYLNLTVAALIYSAGVSLFFDANQLAPGGVTGIAIIISRFIPVETGTLIFLLNLPILLLGAWKFGLKFIISTVYCTFAISLFTNLFSFVPSPTQDLLISTVSGGILVALGVGMTFHSRATTGGIDILVKILRLKFPQMKTGTLFLAIDSFVIIMSGILFHNFENAMYAAVGVFVNSIVLDYVLYGKDEAKLIFVISDRNEAIVQRILNEIESGVTILKGTGAYSKKEKQILMCVVRKQQSFRIENIVKETDHSAFMIVSNASEIFGEGYKSYLAERL